MATWRFRQTRRLLLACLCAGWQRVLGILSTSASMVATRKCRPHGEKEIFTHISRAGLMLVVLHLYRRTHAGRLGLPFLDATVLLIFCSKNLLAWKSANKSILPVRGQTTR